MHVKMFLQRIQVNDIMFLQGIPECMMMPIQPIGCKIIQPLIQVLLNLIVMQVCPCALNETIHGMKIPKLTISLCLKRKLRDAPHPEKMVLMQCMRHICDTHIVLSFRTLEFTWTCHILLIGTAMVLCHHFFMWQSYFIAIAALFLAAKSEETARPLNNVPRASCEIFHKQDLVVLSYFLLMDWLTHY
ncbi:hypothetical protein P3S67_007504 [Capsicum chacoense]